MEPKFYSSGLKFECTQCHSCCRHDPGYVFLSEDDLANLLGTVGMDRAPFIERYCRWVDLGDGEVLCLIEKKNYDCIFWDNGCTVYGGRPLQCRSYPFWKGPLESQEHWNWEGRFCPGIGRGKLHDVESIQTWLERREANPPIKKI